MEYPQHQGSPLWAGKELLLTAGPANITESVRASLLHPDICHRESEFANLLQDVRGKLVRASGADPQEYTSVVLVNSGMGTLEAVLGSLVFEKKVLIIVNGEYGERIEKMSRLLDLPHRILRCGETEIPALEDIEKILESDYTIKYLVMVHMETTVGKLNPVREVGRLTKKYDKIFIVDAMASFAAEELNMEDDHIDFCIANSNKGIQGVPGLSFVIMPMKLIDVIKKNKPRSYYLDLYTHYKMEEEKGQTLFTPPIPAFFALNQALDELFSEGISNRINRYQESSTLLVHGLEKLGLRPYLSPALRSSTLTTFFLPEGFTYPQLHAELKKENFVIYPGKGDKENSTFRVGNLGIVNKDHIALFIVALQNILNNKER